MKHKTPPRLSSMSHANAVAAVCTGKAQLSAELAKRIASKGHAQGRRSAYRCNQCTWWHMGNSIRPRHMEGTKNASHGARRWPQEAFE